MKSITLIFISLFIILSTLSAQESEPERLRHGIQLQFISNYFSNTKELNINDTLQLDSLFSRVNKAWKSFVIDSLGTNINDLSIEALNNLDAYSYLMMFFKVTERTEQNNELELHLYKSYMLPSMINDLKVCNKDQSLSNLKLIWRGSLSNLLHFGVKYYDNFETSNDFYELFRSLKKTLSSYNNSDTETKAYALKLQYSLKEYEYEIETNKHYYNNQQDISFTYLITGLSTNKYYKPRAVIFANTLIRYYHSIGDKDKSIAILNTLFTSTATDELPRDSLYRWYNLVDPKKGKALYNSMLNKFNLDYFQVSDASINLPLKWNMINDVISQERIKKASYILLDFWYSSCSPCIAEVPKLNVFYSSLKDREDIVFISINADYYVMDKDKSYVNSRANEIKIEFPIVYDDEQTKFIKQFNVNGYPSKFIIDNQGRIITKNDKSRVTLSTFYDFVKIEKTTH